MHIAKTTGLLLLILAAVFMLSSCGHRGPGYGHGYNSQDRDAYYENHDAPRGQYYHGGRGYGPCY